jgi:hypothetical protein
MKRTALLTALLTMGLMTAAMSTVTAEAAERRSARTPETGIGTHPKSSYYRSQGPKVRGYTARRGGYSYKAADTINTYGDSRTRFGGTNTFRDPMTDRQSNAGPFDHGFFFDSGMGRMGGNAPYMH